MQLSAPPIEVTTIDGESFDFQIAVNAKSFRLLFDDLYNNKIESITRELCTNAYDSHKAAGILHVPFELHLPTWEEPWFSVRDFGGSLTHEDMRMVTTAFASTKDESDEFVGAFGVGYKSFFSYTDSATFDAFLGGMQRSYLASTASTGIPRMTLISDLPSDEPQGVMVKFAVAMKDYDAFRTAANRVAMGFDVLPTVVSGTELLPQQLSPREVLYARDNWEVISGATHYIKQGCVLYPVSKYEVDFRTFTKAHHTSMIIDVPVGTVRPTMSREQLSMDDKTKAAVIKAFADATDSLIAYINEQLAASKNTLDAERNALKFRDQFDLPAKGLMYKGRILTGYVDLTDLKLDLRDYKGDWTDGKFYVKTLPQLTFVVVRSKKKPPRQALRLREWGKHNGYGSTNMRLYDPTPKQLSKIIRRLELGRHQIIAVTDLPDVPVKSRLKGMGAMRGCYTWGSTTSWNGAEWLKSDGPPEETEFTWVPIDTIADKSFYYTGFGSTPYIGIGGRRLTQFNDLAKAIDAPLPIYYLTPSTQKRLGVSEVPDFKDLLYAFVEDNKDEILVAFKSQAIDSGLPANAHLKHFEGGSELPAQVSADLVKKYAGFLNWHDMYPAAMQPAIREAIRSGEAISAAICKQVPLLTHRYTDEDVVEYINFRRSLLLDTNPTQPEQEEGN